METTFPLRAGASAAHHSPRPGDLLSALPAAVRWAIVAGMPDAPCSCGCPNTFSTRDARADLERYQRNGPQDTTRALIDAIAAEGVAGATLLDIGAGIGAIQLGLLPLGLARAESVDASPAFVRLARGEAARQGLANRTNGRVGDFVALAPEMDSADIVTLDRVVCCYSDVASLMAAATNHARRVVGLVYPRVTWWLRAGATIANALMPLLRQTSIIYIHPDAAVDEPLRAAGFERRFVKRTLVWQVALYVRQ
jgi:magnesium-protoporphyrin O-methyltransferase